MHVVEQHDERRASRDVAEQAGETLKQPRKRRIPPRHGAADEGNAMEETRQIVEQPAAQLDHVVVRARAKERVDRLGPQTEGGAGRQRVRLADQAGHLAMARQQLAPKAALADARFAQQQDEAELSGHGAAQLILQRRELLTPADQLRTRTP